MWDDHCVFTGFHLCLCNFFPTVCICLQITQRKNGAEETQRSGQHTSGPLEGEIDSHRHASLTNAGLICHT